MKKIFFFAALAALGASCSDNDSDGRCTVPDEISVNSVITNVKPANAADSRTTITGSTAAWANNDAIGVYCAQSNPAAVNDQFTVTGLPSSPVWTPATAIYWVDGSTMHKFLGYSPYASGNTDPTAVKIPALNSQTGTIAAAQDFLISNGLYTTGIARTATVPLVFTHAFSLIELKMSITGFTAGTTLTNFVIAGAAAEKLYTSDANSTINLSSGAIAVGTGTNTSTITPSTPPVLTTTAVSYYAIILPATYAGPTLAISVQEGSTAITPSTVALGTTLFEAGKKYTYTVNISRTQIVLSNITITDWVSGGGGTITPGV